MDVDRIASTDIDTPAALRALLVLPGVGLARIGKGETRQSWHIIDCCATFRRLHHLPDRGTVTLPALWRTIPLRDRSRIRHALTWAEPNKPITLSYDTGVESGHRRRLHAQLHPVDSGPQRAEFLVGVVDHTNDTLPTRAPEHQPEGAVAVNWSGVAMRLPDTLLVLDRNHRLQGWHLSNHDPQLCGIVREPHMAMPLLDLLPEPAAYRLEDLLQKAATNGKEYSIDYTTRTGRQEGHFSIRIIPEASHGLMLLITDITERKRLEMHLDDARIKAENSEHLKSRFLAHMSHDLRTPMTSAIGYLELLKGCDLGPDERDLLEQAVTSATSQLRLLDDIIDLSRLQSGDLELHLEPTIPGDLASEVCDTLDVQARQKGLDLMLQTGATARSCLLVDPVRIRQILFNLITNAIKYTSEGQVVARVDGRRESDGVHLLLSVEDTGPGISPNRVPQILEPFTRNTDNNDEKVAGFGLGLAICKRLVDRMGGALVVDSRLGKGSRFTADIPCESSSDPSPPRAANNDQGLPNLDGWHILIAEDDPHIQNVICQLLEQAGATVTRAGDGLAAERALLNSSFDLALLDCSMPGRDGREVCRRVRAHAPQRHLPILALTALATETDQRRCLDSGMDGVLLKPFTRSELGDRLRSLQGPHPRITSRAVPAATNGHGRPRPFDPDRAGKTMDLLAGAPDQGADLLLSMKDDLTNDFEAFRLDLETASDHGAEGDGRGRRAAHRLKSRCALLGYEAAAAAAERWEAHFTEPPPDDTRPPPASDIADLIAEGGERLARWADDVKEHHA